MDKAEHRDMSARLEATEGNTAKGQLRSHSLLEIVSPRRDDFFVCLLVIFAAEVTAGVIAFLGRQEAVKHAKKLYTDAYYDYVNNKGENTTLQDFHTIAKCCGIEDPKSAENVRSLCVDSYKEHKDCLPEIEKVLHKQFQIVGILAVATAGITIFGMIFSMVLCCAIRNSRDML
ncbi:hypothetical protein GDO81_006473 [Engystomops pustulosus]|uniref:Tetraspanin n=1 Tax=Engystomops pustulosus TaxID=76066 RepID=A0AAV7CY37_ENGPU|nr:hypothetical protein GDO81_006473 [Engystomops pustulosus]